MQKIIYAEFETRESCKRMLLLIMQQEEAKISMAELVHSRRLIGEGLEKFHVFGNNFLV
jgi:hypothetical protein